MAKADRPIRPIVLIHGAWCGGWIWHDVATRLEALGHIVFAPTLPGLGERAAEGIADVNLSVHIDAITRMILAQTLSDICLVGHSYGGLIITGVADRVPAGTIGSIVYLDALYLSDGERSAAADDPVHRPRLFEVDGVRCLAPPDTALAFGLKSAAAASVNARMTPMPAACFAEKPVVRGARDAVPHKMFVRAAHSTLPFFHPMAAMLSTRDDWQVVTIDTDHLMMVEAPDVTADLLHRAACA